MPAAENEGGASGPHTLECGMLLGVVLNPGVSRDKGFEQSRLGIVAEGMIINFADRFHSEAAGFLAALVAAHAVGNYGEPSLALEFLISGWLPIEVGVLIVFALAAHVAQAGHFNSGFHIHAIDRHFLATSTGARKRSEDDKRESRLPTGGTEAAMCPGHYRQETA